MWPARIRLKRPGSTKSSARGKWQSRIRKSASESGSRLRRLRIHERASTPASSTRTPRSSSSTWSSFSSRAGAIAAGSTGRENGSRLVARSWFPSTTYGASSRSSKGRSVRRPRGRETRSPVTQTRSGRRDAVHSTARRVARSPPDSTPRWKSERCAIRSPSSAGGRPGTCRSCTRSRTQPASNTPQPRRAAAIAPRTPPARRACCPAAPEGAPPPMEMPRRGTTCVRLLRFEVYECRPHRHDVALEAELRLLEAGGDADQLREVEDRHPELPPGRLLELRLPRVEREVAERAGRHHHVSAGLDRLLDRLDQLAHRRLLARLDDREAAALDLRRVVDRLAATGLDDPLERPRPVGVLETEELRRPQDLAAVERRHLQPLQPLVRDLLEQLVAVSLRDLPEEVAHVDVVLVRRHADAGEVVVHARAECLVALQLEVRLP